MTKITEKIADHGVFQPDQPKKSEKPENTLSRRNFVRICLIGAPATFAALTGLLAGSGCASVPRYLLESETDTDRRKVPLSELDENGRLVVVDEKTSKSYLIVADGDEYSAVELTCTHRGCALQVRRTQLYCPCHGSRFSNDGEVLEGPADRPLLSLAVTRRDEMLILDEI